MDHENRAQADELWRSGGTDEAGGLLIESDPMSGALAPGGKAAIVDRRAAAVHLLSPEGEWLRFVGRRGQGPGELQDPRQVGFSGDTLFWVSDAALQRITWFRVDGTLAEVWTKGWEPVPRTERTARGEWVVGDKAVFGKVTREFADADSTPLVAWDSAGHLRILEWIRLAGPGSAVIREKKYGLPVLVQAQPIASYPILGTPSGAEWFFALERAPATGEEGEISIRRYTAAGEKFAEIRIPYRPRPTDDGVREYLDGWARAIYESIQQQEMLAELKNVQLADVRAELWMPQTLPPVREAIADADGFWLLRESQAYPWSSPEDNRWERFGLDGAHQATLQLPTAVTVIAARGWDLLGYTRDSLGVAEIRRYKVRKPDPEDAGASATAAAHPEGAQAQLQVKGPAQIPVQIQDQIPTQTPAQAQAQSAVQVQTQTSTPLSHTRTLVTTIERGTSINADPTGRAVVALPTQKRIRLIPRPGADDPSEADFVEVDLAAVEADAFPARIGWDGNVAWGLDRERRHLVWFDSLWNPVEERTIILPARGDGVQAFRPLALVDRRYAVVETSGNLLGMVAAHGDAEIPDDLPILSGPIPDLPLWLTSFENEVVDTVASISTRRQYAFMPIKMADTVRYTFVAEPFTDHPLFAIDPTGTHLVLIQRPVAAKPTHFTLERRPLRHPDRGESHSVEVPIEPRPLAKNEVIAALDDILARQSLGDSIGRPELEAKLFIPDWRPPVTAVRVGPDGAVWVRRELTHNATTVTWEVLDHQNERLGQLEFPTEINIVAVSAQGAWGLRNIPSNQDRRELWYVTIERRSD